MTESKLLYLHVPKAGGTTLNDVIKQLYSNSKLYFFDTANPDKSYAKLKRMDVKELDKIRLIYGHFSYGFHEYFKNSKYKYFTILRDPIERVVSHYYYSARKENHYLYNLRKENNFSLEEYITSGISGEVQNGITKQIAGLYVNDNFGYFNVPIKKEVDDEVYEIALENIKKNFAFIGFLEDFNLVLNSLADLIGGHKINYKYSIRNKNESKLNGKYIISEEERNIIKEYNKYDIELYNFCKKLVKSSERNISDKNEFNSKNYEELYLYMKRKFNRIF